MFRHLLIPRFVYNADGGAAGAAAGAAAAAAAAQAGAQGAAAGAAAAAKPAELTDDQKKLVANAELFNARLAEERGKGEKAREAELLAKLGFKDTAEAEAFSKAARAEAESKKTELQKAQDRAKALEPLEQQTKDQAAVIATYAKTEFEALPDEAKKLVTAQAGEDPVLRLKTISALRESGVLAKLAPVVDPKKPANSRAGVTPPAPAGTQQKHPREMTPEEFKKYQAERLQQLGQAR